MTRMWMEIKLWEVGELYSGRLFRAWLVSRGAGRLVV